MTLSAEEAVHAFLAAYNDHDVTSVMALFAPDATYEDVGMGMAFEGHDQVREYIGMAFQAAPDCRWELRSIVADEGRAAFESTWSGTISEEAGAESGRGGMHMRLQAATVVDMAGGLVSRLADYHNPPQPADG